MLRMLLIGYLFAIRSERALCREVKGNLAYRWLSGEVQPRGEGVFGDPR
jgi:transposase